MMPTIVRSLTILPDMVSGASQDQRDSPSHDMLISLGDVIVECICYLLIP
jgi:hypothetical protein